MRSVLPPSPSHRQFLSEVRDWKSESEYHSVVSDSLRPQDYTVHGILQVRILEWVAFPVSRGSSRPRTRPADSCVPEGFFTKWATREARRYWRAPAEVKGGLDWTGINQKTGNQINDPFAQSGCQTTTPQKLALGLFLHPWNPVLCDTCWDCEEQGRLTACECEKGNLLPFLWMIKYMDTAGFLFPTSDPFQQSLCNFCQLWPVFHLQGQGWRSGKMGTERKGRGLRGWGGGSDSSFFSRRWALAKGKPPCLRACLIARFPACSSPQGSIDTYLETYLESPSFPLCWCLSSPFQNIFVWK